MDDYDDLFVDALEAACSKWIVAEFLSPTGRPHPWPWLITCRDENGNVATFRMNKRRTDDDTEALRRLGRLVYVEVADTEGHVIEVSASSRA